MLSVRGLVRLALAARSRLLPVRLCSSTDDAQFDRSKPAVVVAGDDTIVCWHPKQDHPYEHSLPLPADVHVARRRRGPLSGVAWRQAAVERHREPTDVDLQNMFHASKHEFLPNYADISNRLITDELLADIGGLDTAQRPIVTPVWLGRLQYNDALRLQLACARRTMRTSANFLLLLEHEPVYTVGIRTKEYGVDEQRRLEALGAQFVRTARGGLITFHGPGQLVAYPILNLRQFKLGVRAYVERLEQTLIDALTGGFAVDCCRSADTGVWLRPADGARTPTKKLAAVGIRVRRHITEHGVALNCNTDLRWFDQIVPCGLLGKNVTSVSQVIGREVTVGECLPWLLRSFAANFRCVFERLK